jgi:hypothetical protein
VEGCGTAGCAIGWVPSVPALKRAGAGVYGREEPYHAFMAPVFTVGRKKFSDAELFAQTFFGLTFEEVHILFVDGIEEPQKVTPKKVANRIRRLVAES